MKMIDNYNDLTLGKFMQVNAALERDGEEIDKQVEIIAVLADKTVDEVLLLPLADYARMAKKTAFLREPCKPAMIGEEWHYGYLWPVTDFRKINTAQYVDFQTFSKDFPATLPQLLSVFLVPDGMAYNDGYDPAEVQEVVKGMPLPTALGLAAFFFVQFSRLTGDSLTSWAQEMKRTKDMAQRERIARKITEVRQLLHSAGVGLPT
jgi:hypothetical protein